MTSSSPSIALRHEDVGPKRRSGADRDGPSASVAAAAAAEPGESPAAAANRVPEVADEKFTVQDLKAGFSRKEVLHGINMAIPGRTVTALIGPSGCGKSTFIRCLNRMHELVPIAWLEGRVELDGHDVYDSRVDPVLLRRRVGMVFQRPNPFPSMSIKDNVLAGLRLTRRFKRGEAAEVVERALTHAALWDEVKDRLDDRATGLSGGQQQRLCIARSIAVEPDVLLMDEPCSALDPVATGRIEDLIQELRDDYTIVIVTHNMQQAARVSDRTAFLLNGELVEFDDTTTLFTSPRDQRTEDYITGRFG